MEPVLRPRIKICCIMSIEEARLAIKCGASAIGLVSEMPSGPGIIREDEILEIANIIPPGISSFLLTSKQNPDDIIKQQKKCRTNTIQICDSMENDSYKVLKNALPGISIVQVVHINENFSYDNINSLSNYIDGVLLDSGNQFKEIKELGGTGRIHNWQISKMIRDKLNIPIYLAGGLNPDNITNAINTVKPFGVDVCSGVRTNGKLDETKLSSFIEKVYCTYN